MYYYMLPVSVILHLQVILCNIITKKKIPVLLVINKSSDLLVGGMHGVGILGSLYLQLVCRCTLHLAGTARLVGVSCVATAILGMRSIMHALRLQGKL